MTNAAERFATLDGIRAVAALLVVAIHAPKLFPWLPAHNGLYLAVDLFFCLSGFVLARTYRERLRIGTLTPGRFLLGRAGRFYPLYVVGLLAGMAPLVMKLNAHNTPPAAEGAAVFMALAGFLYLPSPLYPRLFPLDSPAWSLAAELVVNATYAILVRRRYGKGFALVALVAFVSLALYAFSAGDLNGGWSWGTLPVGIARGCLSFLIGVFLASRVRRERLSSNLAALLSVLAVPALLLAALAWPLTAVCIAFPALVFIAAHIEPSGVTRTIFLLGGRLSYGVYIIHAPLAMLCEKIPFTHRYTEFAGIIFVASVAALVWLLERYYVPRVRQLLGYQRADMRVSVASNAYPRCATPTGVTAPTHSK